MLPLRPSAAPMWSVCPGYRRLGVPAYDADDEKSPVRAEGTACHEVAQAIGTGMPVPTVARNGVEIDDDMREAATAYVEFNRRTMGSNMRVEEYVECHGVHAQCVGTPDAAGFDRSAYEIHISDLKYGFRYVEPTSAQLVCYADGVARKHNVDLSRAWVNLTIYQPRKWHKDGAFRTRRIHGSEILNEIAVLNAAALATEQPDAPCVINHGCGDCTGRSQCPTLREAAMESMSLIGRSVPTGLPLSAQESELRLLSHAQKLLDAYVSGLQMVVEHNLKAGARGSHYMLAPGAAGRLKWREGVADKIAAAGQLTGIDVFAPQALRTPTQLKKLLGDDVVNMYAERPASKQSLVPIDLTRFTKLLGKL